MKNNGHSAILFPLFAFNLLMFLLIPETIGQHIVSVGTADRDVISVVIESPPAMYTPPPEDPAIWTVNGIHPLSVGRYSYVWDQEERHWGGNPEWVITLRHHMYLKLPSDLTDGQEFEIVVPGCGIVRLPFDETQTPCEAIRVNQEGYFYGSGTRYANFAIWNGSLGTRKLDQLPGYTVLDNEGAEVLSGTITYREDDTDEDFETGEYIYRIGLTGLPEGGPYRISVDGYGCSHAFGVGQQYLSHIERTHFRGIFHQRCGIALEEPFTAYTRDICHATVEVTDAEPPGFITERGESRSISGGYHDAGDFDRRLSHTLIPGAMLCLYEAYPEGFSDDQYNIPESGNGIPDLLDEALWGLKIWEELQEPDGAVRAGTEADGHPEYGAVNAATDDRIYKTYKRYGHTTAAGAGLFAHASRLVQPFDTERADSLLARAERAYAYLADHGEDPDMESAHESQRMYAALQLYLATGEPAYHDDFKAYATVCLGSSHPMDYRVTGWNLPSIRDGAILTPYFFSYLITGLETDAGIREAYTQLLDSRATQMMTRVNQAPYPDGSPDVYAWGTSTNQGRYAEPLIMMYRLTGEQDYLDAISQLADYTLGLNPLGRSYVTGLGKRPPNNITHLDSYFSLKAGKGLVPGIVIYGPMENPGSAPHIQVVHEKVFPSYLSLPAQKMYTDGWSLIPSNEFTTWETQALNACMYGFLRAMGGDAVSGLPGSPGELSVDSLAYGTVLLSWKDPDESENYFRIERKESTGSWELIGSVPSGNVRFHDMTAAPGGTYQYRVYAYNGSGNSGFSNTVELTMPASIPLPAVPLNPVARAVSSTRVDVSWADAGPCEQEFIVERKSGADGTYGEIAILPDREMVFRDRGLSPGTEYAYRVKARNASGSSGYSLEVTVKTKTPAEGLSVSLDGTPCTVDQMEPYAGGVAGNSGYEVQDDGSTLYLFGNAAVRADMRYLVTPRTVIAFDVMAIDESQVLAIGMDDDNQADSFRSFLVHGSEIFWGNPDFNTYNGYGWQHFVIPVGRYYEGVMEHLFFLNDPDDDGNGMGYFRNIVIRESSPPDAPSALAATAQQGDVMLTWDDRSAEEEGFYIQKKLLPGGAWQHLATVTPDVTSYTDPSVPSSVECFYRVAAFSMSDTSDFVVTSVQTPAGPAGEPYTVDGNTVALWHLDSTFEDAGPNGFSLVSQGGGDFSGSDPEWMDTPSGYAYRLYDMGDELTCAVSAGLLWPGGNPSTIEFRIMVNELRAYSIENATLAGLYQAWDAYYTLYQGKWDHEAKFDVNNHETSLDAGLSTGQWTEIAIVFDGTSVTFYHDRTLFAGPFSSVPGSRSDDVKVILGNFDGYIDEVRVSDIARRYGGGSPPPDPSGLAASVLSESKIGLSWLAADDVISGYRVERREGSEAEFSLVSIQGPGDTTFTDDGLPAATEFEYRVAAFAPSGVSGYVMAEATTADPAEAPVAPGDLVAELVAEDEVRLTWTDLSDSELWFRIERKTGEEGTWTQVGTADAGETACIISGLKPTTLFYFRVRAWNTGGNSGYSNESSVLTPLAAPGDLSATVVSGGEVELSWTYIHGQEDGFIMERKEGNDGAYAEIGRVDAAITSFTDQDLEQETRYTYRVAAYNDTETSGYSDPVAVMITGIGDPLEVPSDFGVVLHPNPFRDVVVFSCTLPERAHVTIELFDLTGRKMADLFHGYLEAGQHGISRDVSSYSTSVSPAAASFCRIVMTGHNGSYIAVRKLVSSPR